MSLFQAFLVALLCIVLATNDVHCFKSIKAPKESISRYESVVPIVTPSDGYDLHPKLLQVAIHSQTYNFSLLLEMNEQLISPHFTSRYYNEDGQEVVTKGHINCFYHGRVIDHPDWKATMSTCHGLQGAFGDRHDENNYFHLEPLDLENGSLEQVHALYLDSEYQHKTGTCGSGFGSMPSGGDVLWPNLDETQHNIPTRLRRQSAQRIVEWIVVNDNRQYIENNRNLTATVIRALTIANDVDALFRALNIRVVLIDVITWVNGDEITVSPDPNTLLTRLQGEYRPRVTTPYDSLMLLTGIDLTGSTVGFAFIGTMCSETHSVGLTQDGGRNPTSTASVAAHELGHIFNMRHDDGRECNCADSETTGCIMSAVSGFPPPNQWSNCSVGDLIDGYVTRNLDECLFNEPTMTVGDPVCGNGIREGDEVCDCGSPTECADPCCNPNTCQLATGAQCTAGPCCNSTCHFVSYGTQCRAASGECDIVEYCTGNSPDCPADVHTADGTSCANSTGFCYTGLCPTYNAQCQNAFGSNKGADVCYELLNIEGDIFGHCGQTSTNYFPCSENNVQCGQLHCMNGEYQANPGVSVTITNVTIGNNIICRAFTTRIGADVMSPGLVQDGTKCDNDRVCLSQMCVPVSQITTLACEAASNGLICSGNGVCNNHGNCSCDVGYTGSDCEVPYSGPDGDMNECAVNNGGCAQICTDTPTSFTCSCNAGYFLDSDGLSCRDINECTTANGNCAQLCNNTVGSFTCGCNEGYLLSSDGRSCMDINECSSNTHDCQQNCINTIGSFNCSCNTGYQLHSDLRSCSDVNECATANGNCAQLCNNTVGSFTCGCNEGFLLSSDGRSCMDINECTLNTHDCEQNCINTVGSFVCSCNAGYQRHSDQRSCSDINECVANTDGCDQGCQNTIGSFQCTCNSGYVLSNDERTCSDIDECLSNSGGCTHTCVNTVGSFRCMCDEGYTLSGDGRTCTDIDECLMGTHECQHICENTAGGFRCLCHQGFQLNPDNTTCSDVDECASSMSTHGCQHICINTDGGFRCDCNSGFELNSDNSTCSDTNECAADIDGCSQVCMNTNGSFSCGCNDGYVLLEDGRTCRDINECSAGTHGCQQGCVNTDGGFRCECRQGFQLNTDGSTCSDIDECATNASQCSQSCTNTDGSFMCTCSSGYSLSDDGITCRDINECSTGRHGCQHVCVNTEGAFRCECNSGYEINSDQITCSDIDECTANTDGCGQICNNTDGSFQCSCRSGFTLLDDGKTCGEVNECTLNTHNCQQQCVNVNGGFRCECLAGYSLNTDQRTCSDINECAMNTSICDQGCNNTEGSFQCFCDAGYSLSDDEKTCRDVNECLSDTHRCQQGCVNTDGEFRCECFAGYSLNADLRTCSDIDECATNSSTCSQVCNNTNGSFNCLCFDGYMLSEDGRTCRDIDECETGLHECQQICMNTVGGFRCECNPGYELNDDSSTCSDIDECALSVNIPLSDCEQVCVNTIGGFRCECMAGFELNLDNSTCSDIDECADASICDHTCVNTNGSFNCFCDEGYTLANDRKTCADINECSTDLDRCQQVCVNTDGGFRCECNSGFQLNADQSTCTDTDECSANTDGCDQFCNNTEGSFQCSCRSGFTLLDDEKTCVEINECSLNTHNCQQQCINEDGGFRCECFAGYSLNADQRTCSDIDECATNSTTCSQVCDNTNGSFNCLCFDGYMLSEDGRTCGDVDECEAGLHECQQLCMNTAGGFRCDCDPGYELNDDSSTCSDIDECDISLNMPRSDCEQVCVNTIGGFRCECMAGFQLNLDNSTCSDIDECANTSLCEHTCVNTNGSFNCFCNEGYTLADDGRMCTDINECLMNLNRCQQVCMNTDGGFRCECNSGFQLNSDQSTCADIDECTADTGGCDQFCNNTEGSFQCSCRSGFTLLNDGKTCVEINECTLNTHNCQQQCINEDGGFRCECFTGYSLNVDQRTCSDINECRNNSGGCNQGCNNTDGSFVCTCEDGYVLSDDDRTCVDINECTTRSHGCQQACVNTEGQYRCGCYIGYVINDDLRTCTDVNECETEANNCDQLCENTVGSFQCGCNEGYFLNNDGKTCEDVNECTRDTDNCQQGCTNTIGSFECTCFTGYELNDDQRTCTGTGRIFTLVNSTTALLVEGRNVSLCVELVQSTSQPDTLQSLRIIQVISRTDSQNDDASVLEHGDFIDFNSNPDTGVQRVSCVSIGIEEDLVYTPDRMFLVTLQPVESGDRFDGPSQISIEIVENGIKFLDIAGQEGTEKLELRSSDGHSRAIYFNNGIPVGRSTETRAFVGDNGIISFRRGFTYYRPDLFPTRRQAIRDSLIVAPFWSDVDIRLEGEIHYKQFFRTSGIEQEITLLNYISNYVAGKQGLANFTASILLVAQWKGVPPFPHGSRARSDNVLDVFVNKRNSFQSIIVTDGEQTFAVFTYNCDLLEWTGLFEHAVIGYNVGEGVADEFPRFDNYVLSGQPNVNLVACANRERGVEWSNLVYKIGDISGDVIQENRARCLKKYEDDIDIFGRNPISLASFARSCPCSAFQAIRDRRFTFNFVAQPPSLTTVCFIQRFRSRGGVVQECCYSTSTDSFGSLLTQSDSSGSTGSLLLFHPFFRRRQYREYDLEFKTLCCYQSDRCSLYYERRPSDDCASYFPPRFTWGWGDPHITTLDGHQYTFNGWGEYVLVKVENQFELQGRTSPFNNSNATMFSAFAFGVAEAVVEVRVDGSNTLSVLLNGTHITSDVGNVNDTISNDYVDITRTEANKISSSFYNGVSVTVTLSTSILNFMAALPHEFMGNTKGLLGNFNQNDTDDLVYPNGTILSIQAGDRMTHLFGQTWEIISSDSLFTYPEGMSAESFSHPEHEPVFLDEIIETASDEIRQLCGDNAECIFDAIQTGRTDIALDTLETDITNTNDQMITANDPPILVGHNNFFITIRERSYYTFNVTDDHNNFTLAVEGGLPNNASLQIDGSLYTLTWTLLLPLDQISNFNKTIQIIAKDELNATALLSPQIQICACGEGGTCTLEGVLNVSINPLILNCDCSPAYSGRYCDIDVDGCADLSCFEGVDCEDIPAPGIGAMCGPCPDGFDGNGMKCNDVDECINATLNNCQQVCMNSEGGYTCDCLSGYSLINSTHCEDVNECAELNGGCHQVCDNVDGSFSCSCTEGYELQPDNITCMASSFCSNTNECDQNCVLLDGVEQCSCDKGYSLAEDRLTCQDVDECQERVCSQLCNNTVGGFECGCRAGFRLGSDERSCQDIDECLQGAMDGVQLCSNQMICSNTEGSFACLCPTGTTLVDGVCSEICAENYYRQRSTRCAPCPTNSIRQLNENNELCSCINGYGRRQEADADQPCMPIIGFNMEQVTFSEGGETHNEVVHLALSTSSSDEITVIFNIYPSMYQGLVSQEVTFTRGATTASIVVTIEGNMVATDGNKQLSITVNDGANYIAGGTLGEEQYYPTLQITVEEDDDLLPEFGANSVIIMLRGFSVVTFSAERQQQFKQTTASVVSAYCQTRKCQDIALGQKKRQEFQITAENIVLRDLKDNSDQLQFSMFVLINNDAAVLSVDNVLQAIETSQDTYAESGFSSVTGTHLIIPPNPSSTTPSLFVIIGIAIGATAGLSLLLLCTLSVYKCCRVLTHRPKRVKKKTASSDYIIENALATPWPHEDTALDIDKPHQSINLQPMHTEEDRYIQ